MQVNDKMFFKDEEGNKVELEVIAEIFLDDNTYLLLSPEDNEDDIFMFRVDVEDEKEVLNVVDDDIEFQRVRKEYNNLYYNDK